MFSKKKTMKSIEDYSEKIAKLKELIKTSDAIVLGAGAGLSTSAGLMYSGERFQTLFADYITRYNLNDMYSAAFYPHKSEEELWGYWCKHIYHNRYAAHLNSTYEDLYKLICDKNYFVITTNGDHLFLLNQFEKKRVFYTQGDYGLFQCSVPCHAQTYENEDMIREMKNAVKDLKIPTELIPRCPLCGEVMTVNLRKDNTFVEPDGWHRAMERYHQFLEENASEKLLFLELGIGYNTPSIIKYPFWRMTYQNKNASYISINLDKSDIPSEIAERALYIEGDIGEAIRAALLQE